MISLTKSITPDALGKAKKMTRVPSHPVGKNWGVERGTPLGRHFVDEFMKRHQADITGVVLEIKNKRYIDSLGHNIRRADILDIDPANKNANIVTDLATADCLPANEYDCFMINETLQFVFDLKSAIAHAHRTLKPGGVLLATIPCTVQHDGELKNVELWRFTKNSCLRLFGDQFGPEHVEVSTYGNYLTCIAALTGIVTEEIEPELLREISGQFVQGICVRARKHGTGLC